ncbi:MAG: hypothetical protein H7124_05515 [Phycisphaerales bacterium]|nr:hypothetical protein [Hyphomonadaceae bacterium]
MADDALLEFAALSFADQCAVERQLPQAARARLKLFMQKLAEPDNSPSAAAPSPARADLSRYSPWLRKRIAVLLAGGEDGAITPAARQALNTLTARSQPA